MKQAVSAARQETTQTKEEMGKLGTELNYVRENLRGATTQCKSKDMELERLQIKIRRLDKELEMNKTA